jgi:hypothetical protein
MKRMNFIGQDLSSEPKYVKIGSLEPEICGDNGNAIK